MAMTGCGWEAGWEPWSLERTAEVNLNDMRVGALTKLENPSDQRRLCQGILASRSMEGLFEKPTLEPTTQGIAELRSLDISDLQ
eukprot:3042260-Pyramimonas_sp.AAC.1